MEQSSIEFATSENLGIDDYSEWRLLYGGLFSSFRRVVVNEGFQRRDFLTSQGDASVIDPEVLGKLLKKASDMRHETVRSYLHALVVLYGLLFGPSSVVFLLLDVSVEKMCFTKIATLCVWVTVASYVIAQLKKYSDDELTSLVESYQPVFLTEYGVELGFGKFSLLWQCCIKVPGIFLRRPRRSDDDEVRVSGNNLDTRPGSCFPPVYLVRLIPGEIHIDEKEYDAASMKVDAETWALLQLTHQKTLHLFRGVRGYQQVTKVVNEALHKDENTAHMSVEFHSSELPGRKGTFGQRYQFVQRALAPTTTEWE